MIFGINLTIVSLSFAAASVLFYLYLWILALIRKKKAEQQVRLAEARLKRFMDALKERSKRLKEA